MATLRVEDVTKTYGKSRVLRDLNLEIIDGELLALLGPSGSGKTTLLRTIAGLVQPDSGEIVLDGDSLGSLPAAGRNVAMVFQDYALYPNQTAYGNIAFPLRARRQSKADIDRRVQEIAERLEITDCLHRKPDQLSGGQQQRLALARAVARDSKLLLMDEPLSNVDVRLRDRLRTLIKELQSEMRLTILYVTHDQQEAMLMGDRIGVLDQGQLLQVASPQEIYQNPSSMTVAGFIGFPPINWLAVGEDKDIATGIRSEHLRFTRQAGSDVTFHVLITGLRYLGSHTLVELKSDQQNLTMTCHSADSVPDIGSPIEIYASQEHLLQYNAQTGKRIVR